MADSSVKSVKNKKRKLRTGEEDRKPLKAQRFSDSEEENVNAPRQWRNLNLLRSLESKEIDLEKKVELAHEYVNSSRRENADEDNETVKLPRLIVSLNDWVQSLLIAANKKIEVNASDKPLPGVFEACLDYRCWMIFKFCLEESLRLQVPLSFSQHLLRAIGCVARNVSSVVADGLLDLNEVELYRVFLDCVSLVFSSHGGLSKEHLDLWISTILAVLQLVHRFFDEHVEGGETGVFAMQLSCLVLEPFAKFLKVHPTQKKGFKDFVDKLLPSLLHLLGVLHLHFNANNHGLTENLFVMLEEVLSLGLFHPNNIDGFLGLQSVEKYKASGDEKIEDSKVVVWSYHRHLFKKLESIVAAKEESVLSGLGHLFRVLVGRVRKQKVTSMLSEETNIVGETGGPINQGSGAPSDNYGTSNLNAEKRKSLFDFFVQIMEPLLLEMNAYLQALELGPLLSDAHCMLKSMNILLFSLLDTKLYIKTEDISDGATLNFLKRVYNVILSFSTNLFCLPTHLLDSQMQEMLILLSKELLRAIGYIIDIEYEVIENDLTSLWSVMLSFLAYGQSFTHASDQSPLASLVLGLGCQLVTLYSELRQVKSVIFALSKAIRYMTANENDSDNTLHCRRLWSFASSLPRKAYTESMRMLLSAKEFKIAIHNVVRSTPEGQASEFVQQLGLDISCSIEWMRIGDLVVDGDGSAESNSRSYGVHSYDLQAELFGSGLSELYSLVLDSLTVTAGNSSLLGRSLKELVTVIRPYMTTLVASKSDSINQFLSSVMGNILDKLYGNKHDKLKLQLSSHWVFVFFFRLYGSFRSLYRQVVGFMPPDASKKMSFAIGDMLATYAGTDWMERTDWKNEEYFSWISQPSNSLIDVIRSVSEFCPWSGVADCSPLVYALQTMALQRLVDLNRQLNSLGYILQTNDYIVETNLLNENGLSSYQKRRRKWRKHLSIMKQEAADLTEFTMSTLPLLGDKEIPVNVSDDQTSSDSFNRALNKNDEWDLCACSVNKKSLPTAIWCIMCQNIDIWSIHARKKELKIFLSRVIQTSLSFMTRCFEGVGKQRISKADRTKITVEQMSSELITDSGFYEHKFVRRHLTSILCNLLEKSVIRFFSSTSEGDLDLNSSPNWQEVLDSVENLSIVVLGSEPTMVSKLLGAETHLPHEMNANSSGESRPKRFTACDALLQFMCWMPKRYMSTKSFSCCVTCVLNLERRLIESSLKQWNVLPSDEQHELLRLIMTCRRALKHIIMAYCEGKTRITKSSIKSIFSEDIFSVSWLLKSVYAILEVQHTISKYSTDDAREMAFSLMDHTSHIFLSLSEYHCHNAVHSVIMEKLNKEQCSSSASQELSSPHESDPCFDSSNKDKAWESIFTIAEMLHGQTLGLAISLKNVICNKKAEDFIGAANLDKVSAIVSCISGFLWGIASSLSDMNATTGDYKMETWKHKPFSKLNDFINKFADFIGLVLYVLSNENDNQTGDSNDASNSPKNEDSGGLSGHMEFSFIDTFGNGILNGEHKKSGVESTHPRTSNFGDDSSNAKKHSLQWKDLHSVAGVLCKLNSYKCQSLNNRMLQTLLNGKHPKAANLIRQLLIASSAILRLNLQIRCTPLSSLIPKFICLSQFMLMKLAELAEMPQSFCFVWFDGVLKYLQELGNHFSLTNPTLTRNLYDKLIELHLKALGKCISLQGKGATLASHEIESSIKMIHGDKGSFERTPFCSSYYLDELKSRMRILFQVLIRKPAELHLLSAVQAIERALVGVHVSFPVIYEIHTGNADGGKVSLNVAAGVECLDMVLEYTSGRKRLNLVKRHIQSLFAALLNVVIHLQSPSIFYGTSTCDRGEIGPDPGAVILMCVELLTRVCGKFALFELDCWHIAQSLRVPGALFQDYVNLRLFDDRSADKKKCDPLVAVNSSVVDRHFSIELFAACSRLLYTNLKHRKSESEQCIALIQESTSVLLHCLETVTTDLAGTKGHYFSWIVQEGVKCACFLRRVYEELRQQKDVFGRHCFKFLSDYICVYSGYGPLKTGIRREIDQALRSGVYALIDVCSADDLQYLHSVFGEGPCRNTLADLRHEYKLNFQYEGKV